MRDALLALSATPPQPSAQGGTPTKRKNKTAVILGAAVAGPLVIGLTIVLIVSIRSDRSYRKQLEEVTFPTAEAEFSPVSTMEQPTPEPTAASTPELTPAPTPEPTPVPLNFNVTVNGQPLSPEAPILLADDVVDVEWSADDEVSQYYFTIYYADGSMMTSRHSLDP